jgi:hypothetical protein
MARDYLIVRSARLSFQTLVAKQSLEFAYASAVSQSSKSGRRLQLATIGAAAKIVS